MFHLIKSLVSKPDWDSESGIDLLASIVNELAGESLLILGAAFVVLYSGIFEYIGIAIVILGAIFVLVSFFAAQADRVFSKEIK